MKSTHRHIFFIKIKIIIKKIIFIFRYGKNIIFFSVGENCLADNLLDRNNMKSFSSPYSSGRSNIEYILYFEKEKFKNILNKDYLKYETCNEKKVIRNKVLKELENKYHYSVMNGFEFTHHDVINNENVRKIILRRCNRLINLKNKKIYMLYHHRICNETNEPMLIEHFKELINIYKIRKNEVNVYFFTQVIVSKTDERKVEKFDLDNKIHKYVFYTLQEWEGTEANIFYGKRDEDLLKIMINDMKKDAKKI